MTRALPEESSHRPIGEIGKDFVEWVCQTPFGKDFLFRGQQYRGKDGDIELCDLLLLLDDTAVLFEVKTARRDHKTDWGAEQWADWASKRLRKSLSQIERGCRALMAGQVKRVENERQGCVKIDPAQIRHIFGAAVVDHPSLEKWGVGPSINVDGRSISVLTTAHDELQLLVAELSTPGDLVDYLRVREAFFTKHKMFGISELDLLAFYKHDPEEFARHVENSGEIILTDGYWAEYEGLDARRKRVEFDKNSFAIDAMLDILHEAAHTQLPHIEERRSKFGQSEDAGGYPAIAAELARLRRIDRRVIGDKLFEKSRKCVEQGRDRWFGSAPGKASGTAFVFLVSTDDRSRRLDSLELATLGGKLTMNARRIVGIATEPVTGGYGFSVVRS